ncbi:MAG: phosphoribosylaminoimidazole synthetase [Epsilonproteobacteria bacterium]|nr:phosphoribosylaminoimidazole synthetase [Campylobacterota bacterium]
MCAERVTRFMTVAMIFFVMFLISKGSITVALALLAFMAIMMTIWGAFDFCPSIWMLRKILPSCYCPCPKEENEQD